MPCRWPKNSVCIYPICSMYGIFITIDPNNHLDLDVGKYTIWVYDLPVPISMTLSGNWGKGSKESAGGRGLAWCYHLQKNIVFNQNHHFKCSMAIELIFSGYHFLLLCYVLHRPCPAVTSPALGRDRHPRVECGRAGDVWERINCPKFRGQKARFQQRPVWSAPWQWIRYG